MDGQTTIIVLVGSAIMLGYFAFCAISEKLDRIRDELRREHDDGFKARVDAQLSRIHNKADHIMHDVADVRVQQDG